jgi:hypothetical protein
MRLLPLPINQRNSNNDNCDVYDYEKFGNVGKRVDSSLSASVSHKERRERHSAQNKNVGQCSLKHQVHFIKSSEVMSNFYPDAYGSRRTPPPIPRPRIDGRIMASATIF